MTIDKKREILYDYCERVNCDECKLNTGGWKIRLFQGKHKVQQCLYVAKSDEEDIDKALKLIGK